MDSKLTDEELLDLIQLDKNGAFRTIMAQFQKPIYWHIRKIVSFHEDADDVVQNTFIKAWKNLEKFEGKSKFYTWLFRIATNESISHLRSKKRKQTNSLDNEESGYSAQLKADSYFEGGKAQMMLQNALNELPEKQKVVFNLRYFDEMPYKEMAVKLQTSEGALKASYHHAVKKIEAFIKGQ